MTPIYVCEQQASFQRDSVVKFGTLQRHSSEAHLLGGGRGKHLVLLHDLWQPGSFRSLRFVVCFSPKGPYVAMWYLDQQSTQNSGRYPKTKGLWAIMLGTLGVEVYVLLKGPRTYMSYGQQYWYAAGTWILFKDSSRGVISFLHNLQLILSYYPLY